MGRGMRVGQRGLLAIAIGLPLLSAGCGSDSAGSPSNASDGPAEPITAADLEPAGPKFHLETCDGELIPVFAVAGEEAAATWKGLRESAPTTGQWPVIVGATDDVGLLADTSRFGCKAGLTEAAIIRAASKVDIDEELARVAGAYGVRRDDLQGSPPLPRYRYSKNRLLVPLDLVDLEPLPRVGIALLPVDASWKATAVLPWGDYNDNPPAEVHTALLRSWNRRYGAEVASLTGDVIEMKVAHSPTTDRKALALAREQYMYAPDIVQQGLGDVETLAAALKNGRAWYFWWD